MWLSRTNVKRDFRDEIYLSWTLRTIYTHHEPTGLPMWMVNNLNKQPLFYPWVFTEPSPRVFLVLSRSVPGTQKPYTRDQNRSHGGGESATEVMWVISSLALIICKTKCTFQFLIPLSLQTRVDQSIWSVFSSLAIKIHLMHGLKLIDPAWYQIICFYTLLCFFYLLEGISSSVFPTAKTNWFL